jgi:ABC-type multidrug transport system ATPase subunit
MTPMHEPDAPAAIRAVDLVKSFGAVRALEGISLAVPTGTVLGLLGPNGAGKTTAVRILTTLSKPDRGRAEVLGRTSPKTRCAPGRRSGSPASTPPSTRT